VAIITISRGSMSGGRALAEALAERLQYPRIGREVLHEAASGLGIPDDDLDHEMQDVPRMWAGKSSTRKIYLAAVQSTLAKHAGSGDLVYHGLAGQLVLRGWPAVLRVRLIAPFETRVKTLMERRRMDQDAAEAFIRRVDEARARWVQMMYGEDIESPALYDLVINLNRACPAAACAFVAATAQRPEFTVTDEVRTRLADLSLASHVRAALVGTAETRELDLEVEVHRGVVELKGSAPRMSTVRMSDYITAITRSVPGVERTRLDVEWMDSQR
jgi:cytidylate kinase